MRATTVEGRRRAMRLVAASACGVAASTRAGGGVVVDAFAVFVVDASVLVVFVVDAFVVVVDAFVVVVVAFVVLVLVAFAAPAQTTDAN